MNEIQLIDINKVIQSLSYCGIPHFDSYIRQMKEGKSPYPEIVKYLMLEWSQNYKRGESSETRLMINPRKIQKDLEKKLDKKYRSRLRSTNIAHCIKAILLGANIEEDQYKIGEGFFTTTGYGGLRSIKVPMKYLSQKLFRPALV